METYQTLMTVIMIELTEETFILFAAKHYDNPNCNGLLEFNQDLKMYQNIRRMFIRFESSECINERLIINYIVTLNNLFGVSNNIKMLLFKIDERLWPYLRPFLLYLNMDTEELKEVPLNQYIVGKLRLL